MFSAAECCRLDRRRRALIEAARQLFVEQGYEKTTLSEIVDRAGGSLATVYKLFGNKDGLLEAAVFERTSSGDDIVRQAINEGGDPAKILHCIAASFDAHFLDAETVALVRIVIARSMSDRAFARTFFEQTATRTRSALENMFETWRSRGIAMNGSPALLAEIFLAQFVSDVHAEAISHGLGISRTPERLHARTDFFIAGAGLS
ncbi:TetR/AcrR family transcriptional regulator [Qipengyuania sp. XHP0207]|uniref:TetR/AcrR family transcriptional regulator n=1 Tax=Qipengyuania sp. XHP0207 TaxID=3038078 RepID=UPI00241C7FFA|nr:TetR/AcrR family transcriptional regulator [Qipengyuania sp. XHP0207]MDG5748437.1 TetR/AcrR family transcriptional regulator [Qipengyuania sp. XHP0207]